MRMRWLAAAAACFAATPALADAYDGDWHFSMTPYVWLAGTEATLHFKTPDGSVSVTESASPFEVLKTLHFGIMGFADVRKGEWSAFSDVIYASVGSSHTNVRDVTLPGGRVQFPVNLRNSAGMQELVVTGGVGYAVLHDGVSSADAFVGLRAAAVNTSLKWRFAGPLDRFPQTGSASNYEAQWDGIIGVRGRIGIAGTPWFVPYYVDLGTGESHITAQAMTGVGYGLSWGDLDLTYRWLHYQPGHEGVVDKLTMHGFTLGATLRW